jgi:hypothetical protein
VVGEDALDVGEDAELVDERLAAAQQLRLLRGVEAVHLLQLLVRPLQKLPLLHAQRHKFSARARFIEICRCIHQMRS